MQTTRQRIDGTNQHRHNAGHFNRFELRMGETLPETIVFREANYLSWRLLINENYDKIQDKFCLHYPPGLCFHGTAAVKMTITATVGLCEGLTFLADL